MELFSNDIVNILNVNFNFPIVNTPVGYGIEMSCYDAYIYSTVTGSGYLINPTFPFSPKALHKIFFSAFNYKPVTGILDNVSFKYTPHYLSQVHNFLFNNESKIIIPLEFKTEKEFLNKSIEMKKQLENNNINPNNFIIQRIETFKKGNGLEPFMEYITCEYFKSKGYIVESQVPLWPTIGSPDFAGYKVNNTLLNSSLGFHIIELAMIRVSDNDKFSQVENKCKFIVGEAKTSTTVMENQLNKYVSTNLFSEAYEIHPKKEYPSNEYFGLISLDDNYKIKEIHSNLQNLNDNNINIPFGINEYNNWLTNYIKIYLLSNFTNDEFFEFANLNGFIIDDIDDLIKFLESLSLEEIINNIRRL